MRQSLTILAFALAIGIAASTAAQAQNVWIFPWQSVPINNSRGAVGGSTGQIQFTNTGTGDSAQRIENLYAGGTIFSNTAGELVIGNLWITADRLNMVVGRFPMEEPMFSVGTIASTPIVENFWLQVGTSNPITSGSNGQFGANVPGTVTLTDNSVAIAGGARADRGQQRGWLGNTTQFGVNVVSGGTLGTLNLEGGKVENNGRINHLQVSGGSYSGVGTVGSLTFNVGSGLFSIAPATDGDFTSLIRADRVDLTNAKLRLNVSNMLADDFTNVDAWTMGFFGEFGEGVFSWERLFGTKNVIGFDNVALFSIDWGDKTLITFDGIEWSGIGNGIWNWSETGIEISAVPEPATLAVIGLGLAGLGLARRRQQKCFVDTSRTNPIPAGTGRGT